MKRSNKEKWDSTLRLIDEDKRRAEMKESKPYKKIRIPIGEEDLRMFEELLWQGRPPFTWTFDKIDVEFIKDEEEDK